MKSEELDNLNRDELFQLLKGKCKSKAWKEVCCGLIIIIMMIMLWAKHDDITDMSSFIFSIIIACLAGWWIVFNFWFQNKIGNLDTPDRLLYYYKKKSKNNRIICLVAALGWILTLFVGWFGSVRLNYEYVLLSIVFVASVCLMYSIYKPGFRDSADIEIIEKLQNLDKDR